MPPKSQTKARAFKAIPSSKPLSSKSLDPPAPFKRAPETLEPFLSELSKQHAYITHIDTKPRDFKRKIFMVPVLMNIAVIGLILWRISIIGPYYMKICFSLMGKYNETTIDTARMPMNDIIKEILRRTMKFMIDLIIYAFVWPWPRDFFAGGTRVAGGKIGNPIAWRFGVGFRDREIYVRRSRKWIFTVGSVMDKEQPGREVFFANVRKAVDPIWMSEKTGYLMLNKEWDLDWKTMVRATKLVDQKTLSLEDFKTTILVHDEEFGWMVIETAAAGGSAKEEEGRRKIVAFKDELTALGKESLFFKWIELVQYESSRPGGFGPERQQQTMAKAKAMFEAQGVDFDKFWAKVGGMEGMPGMHEM
jgi:hypothetical protein